MVVGNKTATVHKKINDQALYLNTLKITQIGSKSIGNVKNIHYMLYVTVFLQFFTEDNILSQAQQ